MGHFKHDLEISQDQSGKCVMSLEVFQLLISAHLGERECVCVWRWFQWEVDVWLVFLCALMVGYSEALDVILLQLFTQLSFSVQVSLGIAFGICHIESRAITTVFGRIASVRTLGRRKLHINWSLFKKKKKKNPSKWFLSTQPETNLWTSWLIYSRYDP